MPLRFYLDSILAFCLLFTYQFESFANENSNLPSPEIHSTELEVLATEYNREFLLGKEYRHPHIYLKMDSLSDFENNIQKLKAYVAQLKAMDSEQKKTQLWLNLYHVSKDKIAIDESCQTGIWDYVENQNFINFFRKATFNLKELKLTNVQYLNELFYVLEILLTNINEKITVSTQRKVVPDDRDLLSYRSAGDLVLTKKCLKNSFPNTFNFAKLAMHR